MYKIFNGLKYRIETIEDHLSPMEIKYMTGIKKNEYQVKMIKPKDFKILMCHLRRNRGAYYTTLKNKWIENINKKEKKEMNRPFLELKVKRIMSETDRKLKKLKSEAIITQQKINKLKAERKYKRGNWSGGNWVNGENLDKIKFPCLCSYRSGCGRLFGVIDTRMYGHLEYQLHQLQQMPVSDEYANCDTVMASDSLKWLIKEFDIHILKGKVIIFEDKEND